MSVHAREKESENFKIKQQSTTDNLLLVPVTGGVVYASCQRWYVKERRRDKKKEKQQSTTKDTWLTTTEAGMAVIAACQQHLPVRTRKKSEKIGKMITSNKRRTAYPSNTCQYA